MSSFKRDKKEEEDGKERKREDVPIATTTLMNERKKMANLPQHHEKIACNVSCLPSLMKFM